MTHSSLSLKTLALLCGAATTVCAVEPTLEKGPDDWHGSFKFLSQQVDDGAQRFDDLTAQTSFSGRFANVGLQVDTWTSFDTDKATNVDFGEFTELRLRLDYLVELDDVGLQIIPHLQTSSYPEISNADEPQWFGVDAWYMLPVEGIEIGASFDTDLDDHHGSFFSVGVREFFQDDGFDLVAWQSLNAGSEDYHAYLGGDPDTSGFTTLELGFEALMPLPWQGLWMSGGIEGHWWLDSNDQDARNDDMAEVMFSIGVHLRPE